MVLRNHRIPGRLPDGAVNLDLEVTVNRGIKWTIKRRGNGFTTNGFG
jgi:hypothetical protein